MASVCVMMAFYAATGDTQSLDTCKRESWIILLALNDFLPSDCLPQSCVATLPPPPPPAPCYWSHRCCVQSRVSLLPPSIKFPPTHVACAPTI